MASVLPRVLVVSLIAAAATGAIANDFPTQARVEFVRDCVRTSEGSSEEALYKCSCTIDEIAARVDYETWVNLSTVANATPIAGERGGAMRDLKDARKSIDRYRAL